MGVTGAGKTTVGKLLAQKLDWDFADADEFHSAANIEKMRQGIPLDDADRAPWLAALQNAIQTWNSQARNVVLACSALKRSYRDQLRAGPVQFVYLEADYQLALNRLGERRGHFATASILERQFADLEPPEHALTVRIDKEPEAIVAEILEKLKPIGVS